MLVFPRPSYILHLDGGVVSADSKLLLNQLGMRDVNVAFPKSNEGVGGHTMNFNLEYYKQLTKGQVMSTYFLQQIINHLLSLITLLLGLETLQLL